MSLHPQSLLLQVIIHEKLFFCNTLEGGLVERCRNMKLHLVEITKVTNLTCDWE